MSDSVTIYLGGAPVDLHLPTSVAEATRQAQIAALAAATASSAEIAAELARDQAADLVLPANIFVDVSLATAEAAVSNGTRFKLVTSSTGLAEVRQRTGGGSTLLYSELTSSEIQSVRGASNVGTTKGRTQQAVNDDVIRLRDYHLGDGTSATAALAAALVDAAARGVKRIVTGKGHFLLTNAPIGLADVIIEGDGESTRFAQGAANSNILQWSAANGVLRGVRFEGDGTSTDSTNGNAIYLTGDNFTAEDYLATGMGWAGVGGSTTSAKRGPTLTRGRHRLSASGAHEVYLGGSWQHITLRDMDCVTSSGSRALLVYNAGSSVWEDVQVFGGWFEGYQTQAVACTDEDWTGADRVFGFQVHGGFYKNIAKSAIKAKLSKGILVSNVITESCGGSPENAPSGLMGSILLNSIGQIVVNGAVLRANGDAGLVINGNDPYPKSEAGGLGLASIKISDVIVEGTGLDAATYADGIALFGVAKDISIANSTCRSIARHGVHVICSSGATRTQSVKINGCTLIDSAASTGYAGFISRAGMVQIDGNEVRNWAANGWVFENCEAVLVGASDRAGDSGAVGRCYSFNACATISFAGSASCHEFDPINRSGTYLLGDLRYQGDNVYECCVAGTAAASGGPTHTSGTATDGTVRWAYRQKRRMNNAGLHFTACGDAYVAGSARFDNLVGPAVDGTMPANLKWEGVARGSIALGGAAQTIDLSSIKRNFADGIFRVSLTPNKNCAVWAVKYTSSFEIHASDLTATVDWVVWR